MHSRQSTSPSNNMHSQSTPENGECQSEQGTGICSQSRANGINISNTYLEVPQCRHDDPAQLFGAHSMSAVSWPNL